MRSNRKIATLFFVTASILLQLPRVLAAEKVINGVAMQATNYDRLLRLKKIFLFPTVDDLSGVLSPQLDQKLQESFQKNLRFELVRDQSVVKALSPDTVVYAKVAQSEGVHKEAAKITSADATLVLRTKNAGGNLTLILEWRDSDGRLLFSEATSMPGFSSIDNQKNAAEKLLNNSIKKIPYLGTVTGRAGKTITIDLGRNMVAVGDEIELARMVSAQRHPLLGTLVNVDYVKVGKAKITTTDQVLSFAEITEETPSESIAIDNKIVAQKKIDRPAEKPVAAVGDDEKFTIGRPEESPESERLRGDFDRAKARYGYASAVLLLSNLSQIQNINGTATDASGKGVGGSVDGELWITSEWVAGGEYAFLSTGLSGNTGKNPITNANTAWKKMDFYGGYKLNTAGRVEGVAILFALGYQSIRVTLPADTVNNLSPKTFSGPLLKVQADFPINSDNKILAGIEFQPFSSFTEEGASPGTPDSANSVGVNFRWLHAIGNNLWARVGLEYDSSTGTYLGGGSASTKRMAISPGVTYFF